MTLVDYMDGLVDWFVFLQEFHITADGAHRIRSLACHGAIRPQSQGTNAHGRQQGPVQEETAVREYHPTTINALIWTGEG